MEDQKNLVKQAQTQNAMMASLDELLQQTESFVTLADGTRVDIEAAKFKHLRHISQFMEEFIQGFDATGLIRLITTVSERQESAINAGESPYALGTSDIVKEVAGDASILLGIINRGLDIFPRYIALFTSLPESEIDEMDMDDVALVVFAIFGRNYHFFTQQALPVIRGCIERLGVLKGLKQQGN